MNAASDLAAYESGQGDDRVVFVHGSMDRASSFSRAARRLGDLDVLRYDRRGYGRSMHAGVADGISAHVDDLLAVIGRRPATVVGHSLGGVIALAAAARAPETVTAVGAYEAPMPWAEWWPADSAGGIATLAAAQGAGEVAERFMRRMVGDEVWETLPAGTQQQRRAEGPALLAELRSMRRLPAPYEPSRLTVPVVAAHGTRGRPHHQQAAERLAEEAPLGELVIIEGADHGAHVSHPAEFANLVRRVVSHASRAGR